MKVFMCTVSGRPVMFGGGAAHTKMQDAPVWVLYKSCRALSRQRLLLSFPSQSYLNISYEDFPVNSFNPLVNCFTSPGSNYLVHTFSISFLVFKFTVDVLSNKVSTGLEITQLLSNKAGLVDKQKGRWCN